MNDEKYVLMTVLLLMSYNYWASYINSYVINLFDVDVLQVALLLIRHGADVDVEDKEGYTVLGRATAELRSILIDAAKAMLEWYNCKKMRKYYQYKRAESWGCGSCIAIH